MARLVIRLQERLKTSLCNDIGMEMGGKMGHRYARRTKQEIVSRQPSRVLLTPRRSTLNEIRAHPRGYCDERVEFQRCDV